ncbi:hypothetical protein BDY19DRAFT_1051862 [Irpex rosettiformis]|uniref:Uncharacterized protein n=1 Tax=Irpex rosettiformis TaxID=378272 RepID=A0ACB8TN16_9APHY|nr:hypothetical protein BDY19DRAFT_1051862 [Irpex rosettiformis]
MTLGTNSPKSKNTTSNQKTSSWSKVPSKHPTGPSPRFTTRANIQSVYRVSNYAVRGGETPDSTTPPHLKPQCVFLSRYMMRRRSNSGSWKKRGLGGLTLKSVFDRDSKVGRTSPCDRVRTEDDGGIDQSVGEKCGPRRKAKKESGDEKVWDPLHVLLNYILKNSKCEVAIGSDDDVAKLLELGYEISQDQFKKQLRIFKPHIEVSKKGVGYLVHGTNNNIPSAPNRDIVRKTERTTSTSFPPSQGFNSGDRGIYSEATYLDTLCTSGYHFVKWGWKRMQQTKPLSRLSKCKTTDGDVGGGALVGKI